MASLIVFPAIDLKAGQVVRLAEGDMDRATVYGDDPSHQARLFAEAGAGHLHVVDLDGAFAGESVNGEAVRGIVSAFPGHVQLGGGIRNRASVERWFALEKYAQNTGDTAPYEAITKGCDSCRTFTTNVEKIYAQGGRISYSGTVIRSIERRPSDSGTYVFNVSVKAPPTTVQTSSTSEPRQAYGGNGKFEVQLTRSPSGWSVAEAYRVVS